MIGRRGKLCSYALLGVLTCSATAPLRSQTPAPATAASARVLGTLVSRAGDSLTIKPDTGDAITVALAPETSVLLLPPGSTDLKSAKPAAVADLAINDRVLVLLAAGAATPTARRVLVMKSTAIAAQQQSEQQGWAHSRGGVVQAIDAAAQSFTVKSGGRTMTVTTSAGTIYREYAPGSVRFQDAKRSSFAALHVGDQVRVRGTAVSPEALTAEEMVFGSFLELGGQIVSVDLAASRLTVRDSKTKAPVTVLLTPRTELRHLPPELATQLAARSTAAGHGGGGAAAGGQDGRASVGGATPAGGGPAQRAPDPTEAIAQLPPLPTSELKQGDAVLLVATSGPDHTDTATTVLTGAAPLLAAIEGGGAQTDLSAWSLGGGGAAAGATE